MDGPKANSTQGFSPGNAVRVEKINGKGKEGERRERRRDRRRD